MTSLRKIFFAIFLALTFDLASLNKAFAEVIETQKDEKSFGEWKVFCENDLMMAISHCRIAIKFFENNSVISIEPTAKLYSQFLVLIPQIKSGTFVSARVDKNDIILSRNAQSKDFGMIDFQEVQKQILFQQMKFGDFLFLRFNAKDHEKEITVRLNLKDFRGALSYLQSRVSKNQSSQNLNN